VQIAIIADDLTSATDGGIQFARVGFKSIVTLDPDHVQDLAGWPGISGDADSRARTSAQAAARIAECVRALSDRDLLYKTVDSTIRGHLAVELRAAQSASGRPRTLLAPAFPANGRTTRGGRQYLQNIPLGRTAFSQDPYHPVTDDDICSILARAGVYGVRLLNRAALRNPTAVDAALAGASCVVADAETDEDLEALVRAVADPREVLWVGSPGLARALGRSLAPQGDVAAQPSHACRLLVAVGSLNPTSRRQLDALRCRLDCIVVEIDATLALQDPAHAGEVALDAAAVTPRLLSVAQTIVVTSSGLSAGSLTSAMATVPVVDAIACAVEALQDISPFDGFVLTGGDTAGRIARRLGATAIQLDREFSPGVAVGTFTGAICARVLMKAGGFGDDATLVGACQYLRGNGVVGATVSRSFD
jgi:D-threonate/D-erythronate kinase